MPVGGEVRHHWPMGRFLLTAMPFTAHVTPVAEVARALIARGHEVRIYTGSRFRRHVEAAGATLVPWQRAPDIDEHDLAATFPRLIGKKGLGQLLVNMIDCFIATAPAQVADLEEEWGRAPWDALACDETSIGAVLCCERARRPWATIAVLPLNLAGPSGPPSGLGLTPGRGPITRVRDAALRGAVPLIARPLSVAIAQARARIGLPPTRQTMEKLVFSHTLIIATGAPLLDFERQDRPGRLHFVGELRADPRRRFDAEPRPALPGWWPELTGRQVVVVTQGTQNIDPGDLIRPALAALADRDVIVVVTTGVAGCDTLPFAIPANARVAGFIPFTELLPRTSLMVTNGGWGGTLAGLGYGIPLVIAGGDLDKPEVAARVAWSGAGLNLRTGTPTAAAVSAAIDRALTDAELGAAARRVGAQLRALGGPPRAAELLEGML